MTFSRPCELCFLHDFSRPCELYFLPGLLDVLCFFWDNRGVLDHCKDVKMENLAAETKNYHGLCGLGSFRDRHLQDVDTFSQDIGEHQAQ